VTISSAIPVGDIHARRYQSTFAIPHSTRPGCRVDQFAAHDPGHHDHDVAGLPRGHAFPFSVSTHRNHGSGRSPSATRRKSEQMSCHGWLVSQIVGRTRQAAGVDPYCAHSGSSAVEFDGQ
jgi:hypothetical protein